jgi:hypothetical protein
MSRIVSSMRLPEPVRRMRDRRVAVVMDSEIHASEKVENIHHVHLCACVYGDAPRRALENIFVIRALKIVLPTKASSH